MFKRKVKILNECEIFILAYVPGFILLRYSTAHFGMLYAAMKPISLHGEAKILHE